MLTAFVGLGVVAYLVQTAAAAVFARSRGRAPIDEAFYWTFTNVRTQPVAVPEVDVPLSFLVSMFQVAFTTLVFVGINAAAEAQFQNVSVFRFWATVAIVIASVPTMVLSWILSGLVVVLLRPIFEPVRRSILARTLRPTDVERERASGGFSDDFPEQGASTQARHETPDTPHASPFPSNGTASDRLLWFSQMPRWSQVNRSLIEVLAERLEKEPTLYEAFISRSEELRLVERYSTLTSIAPGTECVTVSTLLFRAASVASLDHERLSVLSGLTGSTEDWAAPNAAMEAFRTAVQCYELSVCIDPTEAASLYGLTIMWGRMEEWQKAMNYAKLGLAVVERQRIWVSNNPAPRREAAIAYLAHLADIEKELTNVVSVLQTQGAS